MLLGGATVAWTQPADTCGDCTISDPFGPALQDNDCQRVVEPEGCNCGQGTIWLDPVPAECQETVETPPPVEPDRGFLDRLRGHGPIGMVQDPSASPKGLPAECDEIDVGPDTPWDESLKRWWTRDLQVFGGIDGFKGPLDQGRNGNFGVHEGFNFGAPLGIFDWGWQIGAEATESNFSGDNVVDPRSADRNQFFVTGGIFKMRPRLGVPVGSGLRLAPR